MAPIPTVERDAYRGAIEQFQTAVGNPSLNIKRGLRVVGRGQVDDLRGQFILPLASVPNNRPSNEGCGDVPVAAQARRHWPRRTRHVCATAESSKATFRIVRSNWYPTNLQGSRSGSRFAIQVRVGQYRDHGTIEEIFLQEPFEAVSLVGQYQETMALQCSSHAGHPQADIYMCSLFTDVLTIAS
jgi:hypothetical protein